MKYGGKTKGKVAAYKAMLQRPGFWQAVERSTAWLGRPRPVPVHRLTVAVAAPHCTIRTIRSARLTET